MSLKDKFEKIFTKSLFKSILEIISIFVCILFALLLLAIFICIVSNTLVIVPQERIGESIGLIISSVIATGGVVAGFYFNKKQTYKEIVTRERIKWLHILQDNLSEYLKLTRQGRVEVENLENVSELFYKIIFAINHYKDKEALNAIRKYNDYLIFQGICYEKYQNPINKNIYSVSAVNKTTSPGNEKKYDVEIMKLQHFDLLREDVESKFVEIFKRVWEDVKGEAD